jgi:hypothetical protein
MMTKTKRHDRNDHSKHANAGDVAVTVASFAESKSTASVSINPDHETASDGHTASPDQTVSQPSHEDSSDDFDMAVRELAYFKWEAAGFPEGDGFDFWLEAERELRANQPPSTPE